jgi:hypothetical protein
MAAALLILILVAAGALYFAVRSRDVRKLLAGVLIATAGVQAYLFAANVSVPLLGTSYIHAPERSAAHALIDLLLFGAAFYCGFIWRRTSGRA